MPHTVNEDLEIQKAHDLMKDHHIRHLPVQKAGHLVGVVTDRDLKLAESFSDLATLRVRDIMMPDPYCVTPEASMDRVALEMATHKYGCVIVRQENDKVVGILTANDALRLLGELLQAHYTGRAS